MCIRAWGCTFEAVSSLTRQMGTMGTAQQIMKAVNSESEVTPWLYAPRVVAKPFIASTHTM